MGRPLRLGLLSPYFGTVVGGGERYLATAAQALRDAYPEHVVEFSCPVPVDLAEYGARLGLDLGGLEVHSSNRRVTPVHRFLNSLRPLRPLRNRVLSGQSARESARYDVLLAMVYAIPVATSCPRSLMLCQFPYREPGPELDGYRSIVCQSRYVAGWIDGYWHRGAEVLEPPVESPEAEPDLAAKERVILSVGRFIGAGHRKRQDALVEAFRRLCDGGLEGWELHLAGSVHRDAAHRGYFDEVRRRAEGYPVHLHPDAPRAALDDLYRRASLYWHAAGFGADAQAEPEALEHFGMTTAEGMAHCAVPLVFGAGGQLEVVEPGVTGETWSSLGELESKTLALIAERSRRESLAVAARRSVARFSPQRFRARIVELAAPLVEEASR